jgi:hypothetical protein
VGFWVRIISILIVGNNMFTWSDDGNSQILHVSQGVPSCPTYDAVHHPLILSPSALLASIKALLLPHPPLAHHPIHIFYDLGKRAHGPPRRRGIALKEGRSVARSECLDRLNFRHYSWSRNCHSIVVYIGIRLSECAYRKDGQLWFRASVTSQTVRERVKRRTLTSVHITMVELA